ETRERGIPAAADRPRTKRREYHFLMRHLLLLLACPALLAAQQPVPFTPGMVVTRSTRIAAGSYLAPATDDPVITIRGEGITLDLRGVELVGSADRTHPDRFSGTALAIEGGRNITIRGATIRGYRIAIRADGTRDLRLLDLDLSHN